MNGFERHGINHLSASSVNGFAAEPAMWIMERLLKKWGSIGSVGSRGHAIEDGVTHGLLDQNASVEECQAIALARFDKDTALSGDRNREKHRGQVSPTVAIAVKELRQYGVPDRLQERLIISIPDVPVPFWGNLDYGWSTHGIVLDLKTSDKLTSFIKSDHARQGCLYVYGTNNQMRFAYTTPAKIGVYVLDDPNYHVNSLQKMAKSMEKFLSVSSDPHELAGLLCPNYEDFRWSDARQRAVGKEVFGF